MSNLSSSDKRILEELFEMSSGYVLDFGNVRFQDFISDCIGIDIYASPGYEEYCSKANKLRDIWEKESDYLVGKLNLELLDYAEQYFEKYNRIDQFKEKYFEKMRSKSKRLLSAGAIDLPDLENENVALLIEDIKNTLERGTPELTVDRLHTFTMIFLRSICNKHGISVKDNSGNNYSIHSLLGMIVKFYDKESKLSPYKKAVLKNNISLLDQFNTIRNNSSFAHDNTIIAKEDAEYAVQSISALLQLLDNVEKNNYT